MKIERTRFRKRLSSALIAEGKIESTCLTTSDLGAIVSATIRTHDAEGNGIHHTVRFDLDEFRKFVACIERCAAAKDNQCTST